MQADERQTDTCRDLPIDDPPQFTAFTKTAEQRPTEATHLNVNALNTVVYERNSKRFVVANYKTLMLSAVNSPERTLIEADTPIDQDLERAVGIVAAYVSHNSLRAAELPDLIMNVHASLRGLSRDGQVSSAAPADVPAVPIKKAVTRDYIVCLEDGKKFKSLRRHLSSFHNLTPDQYRAKWNLPSDHPMVAPSYSATRSQLAKDSGLGLIARDDEEATAAPDPVKKPGRGRPRKSG